MRSGEGEGEAEEEEEEEGEGRGPALRSSNEDHGEIPVSNGVSAAREKVERGKRSCRFGGERGRKERNRSEKRPPSRPNCCGTLEPRSLGSKRAGSHFCLGLRGRETRCLREKRM